MRALLWSSSSYTTKRIRPWACGGDQIIAPAVQRCMTKRNCTRESAVRVSSVPGWVCEGPVLQTQSPNEIRYQGNNCVQCVEQAWVIAFRECGIVFPKAPAPVSFLPDHRSLCYVTLLLLDWADNLCWQKHAVCPRRHGFSELQLHSPSYWQRFLACLSFSKDSEFSVRLMGVKSHPWLLARSPARAVLKGLCPILLGIW